MIANTVIIGVHGSNVHKTIFAKIFLIRGDSSIWSLSCIYPDLVNFVWQRNIDFNLRHASFDGQHIAGCTRWVTPLIPFRASSVALCMFWHMRAMYGYDFSLKRCPSFLASRGLLNKRVIAIDISIATFLKVRAINVRWHVCRWELVQLKVAVTQFLLAVTRSVNLGWFLWGFHPSIFDALWLQVSGYFKANFQRFWTKL